MITSDGQFSVHDLSDLKEAIHGGYKKIFIRELNLNTLVNEVDQAVQWEELWINSSSLQQISKGLRKLPNLKKVYINDIDGNSLVFLPDLIEIKTLTTLALRGKGLSKLPSEFSLLPNLETLEISSEGIDISNIDIFVKLKELYLGGSQLETLPPEIGNLENLETLFLGMAVPGAKWAGIRKLPSEIGKLKKLRELFLGGGYLKSFPEEIANLSNLEYIHASSNKITEFPCVLLRLENLKKLELYDNKISIFPPLIPEKSNLEILDLFSNQLRNIPSEIKYLKNLRTLNLSNNRLVDLPSEIGFLSNLQSLDLSNNRLSVLPEEVCQLGNLESLVLSFNLLSSLPENFASLKKLTELQLNTNQLKTLPRSLQSLNLTFLDVGNDVDKVKKNILNQLLLLRNSSDGNVFEVIEMVRRDIARYEGELPVFNEDNTSHMMYRLSEWGIKEVFQGNQFSIPPEILELTSQPKTVLDYYFTHAKKMLNECKLLIVGQGSVGKTSLVKRLLLNQFYVNELKTEGISVNTWQIEHKSLNNKFSKIQANLWDFGGQEIMHATHQFFLTKRSLYLLVLNARQTQEENRVEIWLKIIQSFGGDSPVIIVGNQIDEHPLDIDRTGLQKKYPNIVGILETSAATGAGIEELKAAIAEQVNNLPHVRDLLPETWFTVKTKLEGLGRQSNFITHDKYIELCAENEVSDETSQRTLIGFLHDLGVVLHFQDDPRLEALGILNPQWVTNGVYKILNSHTLFQNKGVLTTSMLDEILNLPDYPRGKRLFIVDMMKKFELCYDIEPDKTFLVPDLLPKDEPAELKFNGVPAFEYAYPVLPSSVITRFIVRMNQKIDDGLVWRTGVVLKIGENKALVKADIEDRKITIAIDGLEHTRRDALSAIRYQLDEIHASIKGLNPEKFVPIPGAESQRYEFLLQLEHDGVKILPVPAKGGGKPIMVDVSQLLSGIESEAQRRENVTHVTTVYHVNTGGGDFTGGDKSISADNGGIVVGKDVTGNIISGNNNKIIQDSYNKIKSADLDHELKQTLNSLTEAIAAVAQSFPDEKTAKAMKNFERLVEEVVQPEPDRQWYSVSIDGLIKAAENLDKLGTPVISLSRKVLSLLTGGVVSQ